jgi:hypothetical protein
MESVNECTVESLLSHTSEMRKTIWSSTTIAGGKIGHLRNTFPTSQKWAFAPPVDRGWHEPERRKMRSNVIMVQYT